MFIEYQDLGTHGLSNAPTMGKPLLAVNDSEAVRLGCGPELKNRATAELLNKALLRPCRAGRGEVPGDTYRRQICLMPAGLPQEPLHHRGNQIEYRWLISFDSLETGLSIEALIEQQPSPSQQHIDREPEGSIVIERTR